MTENNPGDPQGEDKKPSGFDLPPEPDNATYTPPAGSSYPPPGAGSYQPPSGSAYPPPGAGSYQAPGASSYQAPGADSYQAPGSYPPPNTQSYPPAGAGSYQAPSYGASQPTPPGTYEPGAPGAPNYGVAPGGGYPPAVGGVGQPASAGYRFLGALIDGILMGVVFGILGAIFNNSGLSSIVQFVLMVGYWAYFNGQGQTVGKMIMKTKVVDATTGAPIGMQRAAIRGVVQLVFSFLAGLPYLSIFMNPELRGWHDQVANDKVIRIG